MADEDLGSLLVKYTADISDLADKMKQAKSAMQDSADTAQNSSGGILSSFMNAGKGLSSFVQSAGATIFGFKQMASTALDLGQALLSPAETAENTQLSFETLLHSTSAAKKEMEDLNNFAAKTPMQTGWIDEAAAKMLAFGMSQKDVIPDITAIGDSLSGLGKLSETSLNSIVDIFGKIQAQGKITGGDMMQLSTWGIPAWQALSEAMHKPIPVLQDMVSKGLIPAKDALPALRTGMENTFGGGMAKQANTFTGLMSTLASNWQIAMAAIGGPALKLAEQGLGQLGNLIASPAFATFATGVGQKIADVFSQIGGFVSSKVVPAFQQFGPLLGQIGDYINGDDFQGFIADVQTIGNQVGVILVGAFQSISPYLPSFRDVMNAIGGVISGVVVPALDNIAFPLGNFLMWMQQAGPWQDVIKAGLIGIGVAFAAIQIGTFVAGLPALLAGLGAWAVAQWGVAAGVIATAAPFLLLGAVIAAVVAGIILAVQHWSQIVAFLSGVWGSFSSWFMGILKAIGSFFAGIWKGITDAFNTAVSFIVGVAKAGFQFLLNLIFGPIISIANLFVWLYQHNTYFKDMIDAIVGFVQDGITWLQNAWSMIVGFIAVQWQRLVNGASEIWSKVTATIQAYVSLVQVYVTSIWNFITGWLTSQWNKLANFANAAWQAVSVIFSSIWSKYISGPLSSLWGNITKWFSDLGKGAADSGKNFINMLVSGITSGAGKIWDAVTNIASQIWKALGFHSPTEAGPGADADTWMPNFINMMSTGLVAGVPKMQQAAYQVAQPLAQVAYPIRPSAGNAAVAASTLALAKSTVGGNNTYIFEVDGVQLAKITGPATDKLVRLKLGAKGRGI